MKTLAVIFVAAILSVATLRAGGSDDGVSISELSIERNGSEVCVTFMAEVGKSVVRGSEELIYVPMITNGTYKAQLPAIVVGGYRAKVSRQRNSWTKGESTQPEIVYAYVKKGGKVYYSASATWQKWMEKADIEAIKIHAGCCSENWSQELVSVAPFAVEPQTTLAEVERFFEDDSDAVASADQTDAESEFGYLAQRPQTVADSVAVRLPFVLPVGEFYMDKDITISEKERSRSLVVYYHQDSCDIDPEYWDNYRTVTNLIAAIDVIRGSNDSYIEKVVVAGFASPEGAFRYNDRLAWERAVSVKEFVMKNTDMPAEQVILYNGSADWQGLRMHIAATTMPWKAGVLDIIDNTPVGDENDFRRQNALKAYMNGEPYKWIAENIFPKLRSGAFIRVYYDNGKPKLLENISRGLQPM